MSKKKSKRYRDAGTLRPRPFAGRGLPETITGGVTAYASADKKVAGGAVIPGVDLADLLDGFFDSTNLNPALASESRSASSDEFSCIAPEEQAAVFDFFRGLNAADEELAVSHVEHCHYCKEATGVLRSLMRAAGKECLHPRSRGVEEAEADASPHQEVTLD